MINLKELLEEAERIETLMIEMVNAWLTQDGNIDPQEEQVLLAAIRHLKQRGIFFTRREDMDDE